MFYRFSVWYFWPCQKRHFHIWSFLRSLEWILLQRSAHPHSLGREAIPLIAKGTSHITTLWFQSCLHWLTEPVVDQIFPETPGLPNAHGGDSPLGQTINLGLTQAQVLGHFVDCHNCLTVGLEKVFAIELPPIYSHTNTPCLKMKKIYQNIPKSTCSFLSLENPYMVVNRRNVLQCLWNPPFFGLFMIPPEFLNQPDYSNDFARIKFLRYFSMTDLSKGERDFSACSLRSGQEA